MVKQIHKKMKQSRGFNIFQTLLRISTEVYVLNGEPLAERQYAGFRVNCSSERTFQDFQQQTLAIYPY